MNNWAIVYLCILCLSLGIHMAKHGEPQGKYNFFTAFISLAIEVFVLYKAGLFN